MTTENTESLPAKVDIKAGNRGLVLRTRDDFWAMAGHIHRSGVNAKGLPTPEAVFVALVFGSEVGLTAMQAVQNIAVINNRASLYGDALLGICQASPVFDHSAFTEWTEGTFPNDNYVACCKVQRIGASRPVERRFSVADAKTAKLWGKTGRDNQPTPWVTYPARMLQMRARGFALRDAFADVTKGLISSHEAGDTPSVEFVDVHPTGATDLGSCAPSLPEPEPGQSSNEALTEHLTKPKPVAEVAKQQVAKAKPAPKPPLPKPDADVDCSTVPATTGATPAEIDRQFRKLGPLRRDELRDPSRYDFKLIAECEKWTQAVRDKFLAEVNAMLGEKA